MASFLNRTAKRIDIILHWIETCFLTLCFSVMLLIIVAQLVLQGGFRIPLPWAGQATLYLMMWLVCFGSSAATRNRRHISFELLERALPKQTIKIISRVMSGISAVVCMAAAAMGAVFVMESHRIGSNSAVMNLPLWIMYSALPLTAVMISVRFFLLIFSIHGNEISSNETEPTE